MPEYTLDEIDAMNFTELQQMAAFGHPIKVIRLRAELHNEYNPKISTWMSLEELQKIFRGDKN